MPQDDSVTQVDNEALEGAGGGDNGTGDDGSNAEPYLKVNDRTVYKTSQDAIKGFTEAQTRITSLSQFEKALAKYGVKDADTADRLLLELHNRRVAEKKAADDAKATKGKSAATTADGPDDELSEDDKKALKWLERNGKKAGYITKAEADELKARLDKFETGSQQMSERQFNAIVDEAQGWLTKQLTDAKVTLSEEDRNEHEETIRAWIEGSQDRMDKFNAGGAQMLALMQRAFDKFVKPTLPVTATAASKVANQGKTKQALTRTAARVLPTTAGTGAAQAEKGARPGKVNMHKVHEAAWAKFQSMQPEE